MGWAKWEKFSEEELREIITNSKTKTQALHQLGYKNNGHTKIIDKISTIYNIDISHLLQKDIVGQRFGKLLVLEKTNEQTPNRSFKYRCQCDCGSLVLVDGVELRRNRAISCGCVRSKGESLLNQLLNKMGCIFKTQYTFNDLKGQGNGKLKFDFAILDLNNDVLCLIEYQGKQHYEATEYFGGIENLKIQQQNDKIKKDYCKRNNIPLIEIPYWDFDKLNEDYVKEKLNEYCN